MGSLKVFAFAGAAAIMSIPAAQAADLPPIIQRAMPAYDDFASGWYLRGDVGVGMQQFERFDHHQTNAAFVWPASWRIDQKDLKDAAFVGFGVGYQFNNWLRFDVTGEYRTSTKGKVIGSYTEFCPAGRCFDVYDFDHQSSVFLANIYFDLGTWWAVTPFIGAGVGTARHAISAIHDVGFISDGSTGFGYADKDRDDWTFAWAVHAGLAYSITHNLKLEFAYRYLNMGSPNTPIVNCSSGGCVNTGGASAFYTMNDLTSHDFKLGFRYLFNEPVMPPPPLVRKG